VYLDPRCVESGLSFRVLDLACQEFNPAGLEGSNDGKVDKAILDFDLADLGDFGQPTVH